MKRALALTVLLLAACGDDDASDTSQIAVFWASEDAATREGICVNADDIGYDEMAQMWEKSWNGDGTTDDTAIASFLEEQCGPP